MHLQLALFLDSGINGHRDGVRPAEYWMWSEHTSNRAIYVFRTSEKPEQRMHFLAQIDASARLEYMKGDAAPPI
jgi:hypothetical protein